MVCLDALSSPSMQRNVRWALFLLGFLPVRVVLASPMLLFKGCRAYRKQKHVKALTCWGHKLLRGSVNLPF